MLHVHYSPIALFTFLTHSLFCLYTILLPYILQHVHMNVRGTTVYRWLPCSIPDHCGQFFKRIVISLSIIIYLSKNQSNRPQIVQIGLPRVPFAAASNRLRSTAASDS